MSHPRSILVLLSAAILAACEGSSTSTDGLTCGTGTHQEGDKCIADVSGSGGTANTGGDATGGGGGEDPVDGTGGDAQTGGQTSSGGAGASPTTGGTGDTPSDGGTGGDLVTGGSGGATGGGAGTGGATGGSSETGGDPRTGGGTGGEPGTGGVSGSVGVLGGSCDTPGALACAGNFQKLTLVCGASGEWEVNQTCGADEFCDSAPGPNAGICAPPHPDCVGKNPGDIVCWSGMIHECGPDTITTVEISACDETCDRACYDDPCPTDTEFDVINCDPKCGERDERCPTAKYECVYDMFGADDWRITLNLDTIVRIPAGGFGCECDGPVYDWYAPMRLPSGWTARIAPPWWIIHGCGDASISCLFVPPGDPPPQFMVGCSVANSPAVNLYLLFDENGC